MKTPDTNKAMPSAPNKREFIGENRHCEAPHHMANVRRAVDEAQQHPLLKAQVTPVRMTSREIADLVEKRHDNVKRTIETLADRGVIGLPQIEEYADSLGRPAQQYLIGKRDSYVIVAQLSPEFTAKLVDRWQELEAGAPMRVPQTMSQALRLAAVQAEQIEAQAAQLAVAAPKARFVDNYVSSTGSKGFREVCKLLRANERKFGQWLESARIMHRLGGERMPYARHLDAGRFVVKAGTSLSGDHAYNQAKFTPKGITWIAGEWAKHHIQGDA